MSVQPCFVTFAMLLTLTGCSGGSDGGSGTTSSPVVGTGTADIEFYVRDVTGAPIADAVVTVTAGADQWETVTDAEGEGAIADVPRQAYTLEVTAAGFETQAITRTPASSVERWGFTLEAEGAWAIGRTFVLDTRVIDRASDGTAMTFALDVAVFDGDAQPIETLTSAQFGFASYECGWGGPRDCASDADGNATGSGGAFSVDGAAQAFELLPSSDRRPYVLGVLVERSTTGPNWTGRTTSLKSFFGALGGNDTASLMSVQWEGGSAAFSVLGTFTSDGSTYFDAIDQLPGAAAGAPAMLDAVTQAIDRVAAADGLGLPDVERHVLVMAREGLSPSEFQLAAEHAGSLGVRVSTILETFSVWYGFSELAARTGGFVAGVDDERQFELVMGALDPVLAGTTPIYRMQFRLTGDEGTFVSGGNAKLLLNVGVPSPLPNRGVWAPLDVAIP